jgi:Mn-dependent DtxR family transcriptional regulator|tara:strand:- start:1882 stop:2133 length:252 start_codon:yes stop_codon:yes gene_type:complete
MDSTTGIVLLLVLAVVFFVVKGKDKKVKPKSVPSKAKPKAPTVAELKKLTKNQLVELAEKKNLKVKKSGAKAAVISEIREQLK